ncbi:MAG TPA: M14 family metallopeptidase [Gemmatimonadales bacterium]|jgi:hypothetical protein
MRAGIIAGALCAAGVTGLWAQQAPRRVTALTRPERTEYAETSTYADVMAFLAQVVPASPLMHRATEGYTYEGRSIPLIVVGKGLKDGSPESVRGAHKLVVFLQGNIHAGEVEGKEALQILLREIANGDHRAWLDSMVLLINPIYNADGNERITLTNRPRQNGPIGGMGQRPNAQNFDLNRDHMKLESPEAKSFVSVLKRYDPQVTVDLHTTDGTDHAYYLTYSPPLHPNTDAGIIALLRRDLFPAVTKAIKQKHNWDFYYYGNVPGGVEQNPGSERGWFTFDHRPRFNNNYVGLRNRVAILSEAYAYASFEDRISATRWFVNEILDYARVHTSQIRRTVAHADSVSVVGTDLALRADLQRGDSVTILLGEVDEQRNPYTGRIVWIRKNVVHPEQMPEWGTFKATESTKAPSAYFVPPDLAPAINSLDDHGITYTRLTAESSRNVERFVIDSSSQAGNEFQGHRERTLFGHYESASVTLPVGTVMVSVAQPLGRLAFTLLEPRSDDGLVDWNQLDRALAGQKYYPIVRVP